MAEAFARISAQGYRRIIILSPDHFSRSPTPFAVSRRNFQTALGTLVIDEAAVQPGLAEQIGIRLQSLFA